MNKFIILDNVFDEETRIAIRDFEYGPPRPQKWYEYGDSPFHEKILDIASQHFDLSKTIGYEMWCNTRAVGWHFDHDEVKSKETGFFIFPPCAIVYYAEVDDLDGGEFVTNDITCTPVTNRLVMFSGNIHHAVKPYSGIRKAISMNPWDSKIENVA
jgi:hypothetical protein